MGLQKDDYLRRNHGDRREDHLRRAGEHLPDHGKDHKNRAGELGDQTDNRENGNHAEGSRGSHSLLYSRRDHPEDEMELIGLKYCLGDYEPTLKLGQQMVHLEVRRRMCEELVDREVPLRYGMELEHDLLHLGDTREEETSHVVLAGNEVDTVNGF